ncbi:hypothetical protein KIPB_017305, partial [Kipferlia bialata]
HDEDTQRLNRRRTLEQCGQIRVWCKACPTKVKTMDVGARRKTSETSVASMQRRATCVSDTEQSPLRLARPLVAHAKWVGGKEHTISSDQCRK